jgi:NAD(P)-dependent dehydrogenase (short-subunit alcohol dehydrogenase family)
MAKTILITGATEGVGKATALSLAAKGHRLIVHGRNTEKLKAVLAEAKGLGAEAKSDVLVCDLGSLKRVRTAAAHVREHFDGLDVLINNAGAMFAERRLTDDGLEANFAINHLAPMLLTLELLPLLRSKPDGRIINLSSVGYKQARLDIEDLQHERGYSMQAAYFESKLFNLYFTLSLAERLGTSPMVNAVHPGGVRTQLARDFRGPMKWVFALMMPLFFITPEKGAETSVFLADDASVAGTTGRYWTKQKPEVLLPHGSDRDAREALWKKSAELLRQKVGFDPSLP